MSGIFFGFLFPRYNRVIPVIRYVRKIIVGPGMRLAMLAGMGPILFHLGVLDNCTGIDL